MKSNNQFFLLVSTVCLLTFCGNANSQDKGQSKKTTYQATILPTDTTQLWGTPDLILKDKIIIDCPGGPDSLLEVSARDRNRYRYMPNYDQYSVVTLHQAQTFNRSMYQFEDDFTLADAKHEIEQSSEMLHRAIDYFKKRGKSVHVIGASYGAFIIQHYLATKESKADNYILMSGRLDMNEEMIEETKQGKNGGFSEDGQQYVFSKDMIGREKTDLDRREDLVCNRLKAAIGHQRYTKDLVTKDLSNVIYIYAKNDQNVGALNEREIQFLKEKNVQVFADNRGHTKTWQKLIDELESGNINL